MQVKDVEGHNWLDQIDAKLQFFFEVWLNPFMSEDERSYMDAMNKKSFLDLLRRLR